VTIGRKCIDSVLILGVEVWPESLGFPSPAWSRGHFGPWRRHRPVPAGTELYHYVVVHRNNRGFRRFTVRLVRTGKHKPAVFATHGRAGWGFAHTTVAASVLPSPASLALISILALVWSR
jgi:hypothetical protein